MTEPLSNLSSPRFPVEVHLQRISVPFEYPVAFTRDLFAAENPLLEATLCRLGEKRRHRAVVLLDRNLALARPELAARIREYFHDRPETLELAGGPEIVAGGEEAKGSWQGVRDVMWMLGNLHLDRQSYVIAVGGGAMLDMAGFAASIVHRGLRLVRAPTTTLAQADAAVGVKNGMDEHGMKNFVGTFAPPFAVLNDSSLLTSLPQEQWLAGAAEAFKVAIIKDAAFFDELCRLGPALRGRDLPAMERVIRRTALLHLDHIRSGGDPFEFGSARPLDFGHWSAHRLEMLSGFALGHGQAVAIGVALDSYYAMRQGLLSGDELERIVAGLADSGLPVYSEHLARRGGDARLTVLEGLEHFRQHLGGVLTVTLPDGIGRRVEVHQVDAGIVEQAVAWLAGRAQPSGAAEQWHGRLGHASQGRPTPGEPGQDAHATKAPRP